MVLIRIEKAFLEKGDQSVVGLFAEMIVQQNYIKGAVVAQSGDEMDCILYLNCLHEVHRGCLMIYCFFFLIFLQT